MAKKKRKIVVSDKLVKKLQKHPIVIILTVILAIIGAVQSFTWVYDRFLESSFSQYEFEKSIFHKLSPLHRKEFLIDYLGEPQKEMETEIGNNLLLWDLNGLVIGAILDENEEKIILLAAYSVNCNFDVEIPQVHFVLCSDRYPDYIAGVSWTSFWGPQSAGYVEDQPSGRWTKYLSSYYGGDHDSFDLIQKAEEIYGPTNEVHTFSEYDLISTELNKYRGKATPNFIALSNGYIPVDNVMWDILTAMINFGAYNLP